VIVDAGLVVGTVRLIVCMQHVSGVSLFKGIYPWEMGVLSSQLATLAPRDIWLAVRAEILLSLSCNFSIIILSCSSCSFGSFVDFPSSRAPLFDFDLESTLSPLI
jgi:hypothetical protein